MTKRQRFNVVWTGCKPIVEKYDKCIEIGDEVKAKSCYNTLWNYLEFCFFAEILTLEEWDGLLDIIRRGRYPDQYEDSSSK